MSGHMTLEMGAVGKVQQEKFTSRGNLFSLIMDR